MKLHAVLLLLVTSLCLVLAVVPAVASPIPFNPSSGAGFTINSFEIGFPGPDSLSTLRSEAPSGLNLSAPAGAGSYHLTGSGGGPLDPPTPVPTSEPSGIMVMFGSTLFGVAGLWRRRLNDLI